MREKSKLRLRSKLEADQKRGDRAANFLADLLGSIWFLLVCLGIITIYLLWNTGIFGLNIFDPSPFNRLDTFLSIFAIILSISVLISQKRERHAEKIREEVEFEVNVRAENEITKMLEMLHTIQQKLGINTQDQELEEMKKETDIKELHEHIKKEQ